MTSTPTTGQPMKLTVYLHCPGHHGTGTFIPGLRHGDREIRTCAECGFEVDAAYIWTPPGDQEFTVEG